MKVKSILKYLSLVTEMGLIIGITMMGGLLAGLWVDAKIGTGGILTIGFALSGLAAGICAVYIKRKDRNKSEEDKCLQS